jgi:sec-independent protein translocase protein TatA
VLSVPDMAIIGTIALLLFGPEQLPRVAKRVGHVVRDVQNTSQQFLRELERAADEHEPVSEPESEPATVHAAEYDGGSVTPPVHEEAPPYAEMRRDGEAAPYEAVSREPGAQ